MALMKARNSLIFLLLTAFVQFSCAKQDKRLDSLYENLPFHMERVAAPSIPSLSVSLADFGGVGDGVTLNTDAFASAIENLVSRGGGRLVVPAGIWLTGPIGLKSNIELHLEKNAIIVFGADESLYPVIDTNFEGLDVRRCISPINATGEHDIAITGEGVIDGNGHPWREVKKRKVGQDVWKSLTSGGGVFSDDGSVWYPNEGYRVARLSAGSLNYQDQSLDEDFIKTFLRPVLVSLRSCERVLLEGVTFQDSPCWNLHPLWCHDVIIRNITVRNPHYSTNGDGIDIDACENVLLVDSVFDVGDDAMCIKSGKDADGRNHGKKCRNLIIDDCTVYHGHGGFVIGSEMSGGVENVSVSNCRYLGTDVGLRFKSTRGRGGLVKDIWCRDIFMKDIVSYAVIFNLYYAGVAATDMAGAGGEQTVPVDETTPEMRDIHISNVVCSGAQQSIYINGLPELPLSGLSFDNCCFTSTDSTVFVQYANNVSFNGVTVNGNTL